MDSPAEVIEAFSSATVTALRELTQFDAFPVAPSMQSALAAPCIVAVMQLVRCVPGNLALVMSADTADRMAERYLPTGAELTEEIVNDVAGEFVNVIAGLAKTILKGTPYHFLLSLPVVTRSAVAERMPGVAVNFQTDAGQIRLYVGLLPAE